MDPVTESSPGVVALLLDDLAPPRLGTMLRAARKERGSTRREVAQRVGTTASDLRRYERGNEPVPPSVIAALAECYGEDLTEQLATRAPIQLDGRRLVVGTEGQSLESNDADEVLQHYVEIVSRLRQSQPGEPIALRADDLVALSTALGQDAVHVESRIVELLGCTQHEAHSLHAEMLRRKLVLPVAGLVAGIAMVTGAGIAHASPASHPAPAVHAPSPSADIATAHIAAGHIAAGHVVTAVVAPAPTTVVVKPPAAPTTTPPTTAPEAPQAEPATVTAPVITPDTTPMGIPGNETVTIIQP
jgi:transcriptional regulator with XRE-family HTH domain